MQESGLKPEQRTFGFLDHAGLWASLGVTLYVMPFGSFLVPALSLEWAFLAVIVASLLGALVIGSIAAIAAHTGLSSVGLLARPFGAWLTPVLAVAVLARNVLLGAFAISLIAGSAELVSDRVFGIGVRPLWVILFGAAGLGMAVAGPEFTIRKLLKRAGLWLALLVAAVITLSAYMEFRIPSLLDRPAVGGWPSFWQGVDGMLIVPLLWLPVVADYSRFGKSAGTAFVGSFVGFFVATAWFGSLGVVYLLAVETGDIAGFIVGLEVGFAALVLLLLLQTDEIFVNAYSAAQAIRSIVPLGRRVSVLLLGSLTIVLALPIDFLEIEGSLLVLGSVFIPLFGVVLADRVLPDQRAEPAFAPSAMLAWVLGFLLYHWISPPDAVWWQDATRWLYSDILSFTFPLTEEVTWLGAAIPALVVGFVVHYVGSVLPGWVRRRAVPAPAR
jgi:NCS1 family nucleobase:cation symporter-1